MRVWTNQGASERTERTGRNRNNWCILKTRAKATHRNIYSFYFLRITAKGSCEMCMAVPVFPHGLCQMYTHSSAPSSHGIDIEFATNLPTGTISTLAEWISFANSLVELIEWIKFIVHRQCRANIRTATTSNSNSSNRIPFINIAINWSILCEWVCVCSVCVQYDRELRPGYGGRLCALASLDMV